MNATVVQDKLQKTNVHIPSCWICLNKGFILYKDTEHREYIVHCICPSGQNWAYDGEKCEKNKSPYYIPSVKEKFDVEKIAADGFWEWWKNNKDKPGIKEELERRGIPTEELRL